MNILQGIKPSNPKPPTAPTGSTTTKFIIKSKPSVKEARQPDQQNETGYASSQDVHQLITYIVAKSKRLAELLEGKGVDVGDFCQRNLYENACVRTFLKSVMDKMLAERRLGKGLKGINKGILTQIQNTIWQTLEREVSLYQLDKVYEKEKTNLEKELQQRKAQIQRQIEQLTTQQLQSNLILKEAQLNQASEN